MNRILDTLLVGANLTALGDWHVKSPQYYFDVSSIGQPKRFYRLAPER